MKVRLMINKALALLAGRDEHGLKVVEVPAASLTPAQRLELARHGEPPYRDQGPPADFYLDGLSTRAALKLDHASPESVVALLDALTDASEAKVRAGAEEHERRVAEWLACPLEKWLNDAWTRRSVLLAGSGSHQPPDDERLVARRASAEALADRLNAEADSKKAAEQAAREAEEAGKAAAREAGVAALRAWTMTNGSEFLKGRLRDGFRWQRLAKDEWAAAAFAELALPFAEAPNRREPEGLEDPSLEEIQAYEAAGDWIGQVAFIELLRVTCEPDDDVATGHGDDVEVTSELGVTLTDPLRERVTRYYRCDVPQDRFPPALAAAVRAAHPEASRFVGEDDEFTGEVGPLADLMRDAGREDLAERVAFGR